ncbi:MAG: RluA family pseudouridine synthase [Lachnospiraceae bacterium]|nr:RluA family pseudouridine synthase [Lachnospiraceae bacterium]
MKELKLGKNEANLRFDKYLKKVLKEAPNSFIYKMLRKKNITLNGKKADGTEKTAEGDVVKFFLSDETFDKMSGNTSNDMPFMELDYKPYIEVLYEDEDVLFLNKPQGLLTQSDDSGDKCLNDYLLAYLFQTGKLSKEQYSTFHPSVSNRLDRNTSGIVLCGKSLKGSQDNARILKDRTLEKHYIALVKGIAKKEYIKGYLFKDESSNKVYISKEPKDNYLPIETEYEPIETYKGATLLDIHLITGRTHQIRAHLASNNHPLIGDYKYGDKKVNDIYKSNVKIKYQLLHSRMMKIGDLKVEAPMPDNFKRAIEFAKEN